MEGETPGLAHLSALVPSKSPDQPHETAQSQDNEDINAYSTFSENVAGICFRFPRTFSTVDKVDTNLWNPILKLSLHLTI